MKTYSWMAGPKGNAHLCSRDGQAGEPKPVCGAVIRDLLPALAQSKCQTCGRQEATLKKYQAAMEGRRPADC